ncbi:MAG: hypothetical protein PUB49_05130 [Selenomonadaceae bacterium]|nr:hypothetical protein [Selenomonadaceae bacterium]
MAEENLQAFLLENAIKADEIEYVASPRFVSGSNPVPWKISPITNDENEALTNRCRRKQFVPGTRETRMRVDQEAYAAELICACVKYPNLNSEQLQSSYDAVGAADLVKKMLTPGEYQDLFSAVMQANSFDIGMDEKIKKAKN